MVSEATVVQCSMAASPKEARISAELMARHEGLVQWVVRRQYLGDLSFADALAEGRIGLWHALAGYDPRRGTAFSSYAVPAIAHAVWLAVDRSRGLAMIQPRLPVASAPFDPDDGLHRAELQARLRSLVEQLPPRLRLVIVAHHGLDDSEPQSYAAIGRTLHVTRQRAHQLHQEALLYLAHPAHSLALRRLLGLDTRAAYQRSLAQGYRMARSRRSSRGAGR